MIVNRTSWIVFILIVMMVTIVQHPVTADEKKRFIIASTSYEQHLQDLLSQLDLALLDTFEMGSLNYTTVEGTNDEIDILKNRDEVLFIEEDQPLSRINQNQGIQASASYPWGMTAVEGHRLLDQRCHCKVAVVDSGISSHSLLNDRVKKKMTFLNGEEKPNVAEDDSGDSHGTHVAGIIAGKSKGTQFAGVAQDAELYIVKALDKEGNGFISDLVKSVRWAMNEKVDIINLSLGTDRPSQTLSNVLKEAYQQGIVVVAAAGNEGGAVEFPASSPYTIGVGAVNQNIRMQSWSAFGPEVDILAPGVRILSTAKSNQLLELSGTSMAAPHVSGATAKLLPLYTGKNSSQKVEWIRNQLTSYTNPAYQGNGQIFTSLGFLNIYKSYYEVKPFSEKVTVQLANGKTQVMSQDILTPYSDSYKRIKIQRNLVKEEWQLN